MHQLQKEPSAKKVYGTFSSAKMSSLFVNKPENSSYGFEVSNKSSLRILKLFKL